VDTNAVLEDLQRRYRMTSSEQVVKATNLAGNMPSEYIDCAPKGLQNIGVVAAREYPGNQDSLVENRFLLLEPVNPS